MHDYTHFYRRELPINKRWPDSWDIVISAFNNSERVTRVFEMMNATEKHWIVHTEYGYAESELSIRNPFRSEAENEAEFILEFWENRIKLSDLSGKSLCIDATGFMRPHLMFLLQLLFTRGLKQLDILYSEPEYYKKKDFTLFSNLHVEDVRQVAGFEGIINSNTSRDVLIIGAGYETHLIAEVAEDKDQAKKLVLLGLPSLRADMYQQNSWRTRQAADALGESGDEKYFAPASDPFATATVLSEIVSRERANAPITNLYLSPLATKAQAIGFALFYLTECEKTNASIIFPFSQTYERETSVGLSRVWLHTLEFQRESVAPQDVH